MHSSQRPERMSLRGRGQNPVARKQKVGCCLSNFSDQMFRTAKNTSRPACHSPVQKLISLPLFHPHNLVCRLSTQASSMMAAATYVTFDTSVGPFTVELYNAHAPKVLNHFLLETFNILTPTWPDM